MGEVFLPHSKSVGVLMIITETDGKPSPARVAKVLPTPLLKPALSSIHFGPTSVILMSILLFNVTRFDFKTRFSSVGSQSDRAQAGQATVRTVTFRIG